MRVRVLFMLCVSAMASIIAVAAAVFVSQQWANYRNASGAGHLAQATASVLRTTEQMSVSRGPQNVALIADQPAAPPALAAVAAARKTFTEEFENFAYKFETPDGVLVYACDTSFNPALGKFAEGADVLIHETIYVPGVDRMVARVKNAATLKEHLIASHTTTEDVGKIAAMAKVKKLVMTHFVPGDDPTITDEMWAADAKKHYSGPIVVAKDLMEIEL